MQPIRGLAQKIWGSCLDSTPCSCYLTSPILVFPSAVWDNPPRPAFSQGCLLHVNMLGTSPAPRGQRRPLGRVVLECRMPSAPHSCAWLDGTGVLLPIPPPGSVRTRTVPAKPQGTPSSMLVASSSPRSRETKSSHFLLSLKFHTLLNSHP